MSDPYSRDPLNRDPLDTADRPATRSDVRRSNSGLGWIAGAVFLLAVLALIFGLGRTGDRTASTSPGSPPATTGTAPAPGGSATAPGGSPTAPRTTTGQGSGQ